MSKQKRAARRRIAFLFTGQGAQSADMGRALYETQPGFRRTMDRCDEILRPFLEEPLLSVLYPTDGEDPASKSRIHDTRYTQPALFALEYALYELWLSWGVTGEAVMGHSVGEYVAACAAGVFGLEDGLRLIAARGRLMGALPAGGGMVAVLAGEAEVLAALTPQEQQAVSVAAENGPQSIVLSGDLQTLNSVVGKLQAQGKKTKALQVSHAFHSPLMEPMLSEFAGIAREIRYSLPRLPIVSNLTGAQIREDIATPDYWVQQVRQPVRFASGMQTLRTLGISAYLEAGPQPVLLGMGRLCLQQADILWLPSLRRGMPDWESMLDSLGQLYAHGWDVDWQGFERDYAPARRRVALPTYPFEQQRYFSEPLPLSDGLTFESPTARPAQTTAAHGAEPSTVQELRAYLVPICSAKLAEIGFTEHAATRAALDSLSVAYVVAALRSLGLVFRIGERWSCAQLSTRLAIVPQHHRLLCRMCEMLGEAGVLRCEGDEWVVVREPGAARPEAFFADFPIGKADAELALLSHCGAGLAEVLSGRKDPLTVLFPGGDSSLVSRFYEDTKEARLMNHLVGQAAQWAAQRGARPTVRMLEIGAGTGGTTRFVLNRLPTGRIEYTFSDVGRSFLNLAKKAFREYAFVEYRALDIEQSPAAQGFSAGSYDVVIAANVLHATADLRRTLEQVRYLLAPGGLLFLRETTRRVGLLDVTFGLTDGWWRFSDLSLRPQHALLSPQKWDELLRQTGFRAVTWLPDASCVDTRLDESFIVAQADEKSPAMTVARTDAVCQGEEPDDELQRIIRQQLAVMEQQLLTWQSNET